VTGESYLHFTTKKSKRNVLVISVQARRQNGQKDQQVVDMCL